MHRAGRQIAAIVLSSVVNAIVLNPGHATIRDHCPDGACSKYYKFYDGLDGDDYDIYCSSMFPGDLELMWVHNHDIPATLSLSIVHDEVESCAYMWDQVSNGGSNSLPGPFTEAPVPQSWVQFDPDVPDEYSNKLAWTGWEFYTEGGQYVAHMNITFNVETGYFWHRDCHAHATTYSHVDFRSVLMHEMGHGFRLAHVPACNTHTMYPLYPMFGNQSWQTPEAGDIAGISTLYPEANIVLGSFKAVGGPSCDTLFWEDDDPSRLENFDIRRSDECGGSYAALASVARRDPAYTMDNIHYRYIDNTVTQSRAYWYRILDYNGADADSATPLGLPQPAGPSAPSGLVISRVDAGGGDEDIRLSWNASGGATEYRIYRNNLTAQGECATQVGTATSTAYEFETVYFGEVYECFVRAWNSNGLSTASNVVTSCLLADVAWSDSTIALCPAGDSGESIELEATLLPTCGVDPQVGSVVPRCKIRADSSPGVVVYLNGIEFGAGDTVSATSWDPVLSKARWTFAAGRGCGTLSFDLLYDTLTVANGLRVNVRSYDQDGMSVGTVDSWDNGRLNDQLLGSDSSLCGDWNWSGVVDGFDAAAFNSHYTGRHHTIRRLLAPNGGQTFGPGEMMPISWLVGGGGGSKVTIQLRRESAIGTIGTVGSSIADDGSESWTVGGATPGSDYRTRIIHSAGTLVDGTNDYGRDSSDATFTIRPKRVQAIAGTAGRTTASFSWTEPGQVGGNAVEYEIRYRTNQTITEENFAGGALVAGSSSIQPGGAGTQHCVELPSVPSCSSISLGIRTKMNNVWSFMSPAGTASTTCSGSAAAFCDEGLMGGGGGGESAQAPPPLEQMGYGRDETVTSLAPGENSLLWGPNGSEATDYLRLGQQSPKADGYRIRLRETGGRAVALDQLRLGAVDHASEASVVAGVNKAFVGTVASTASVKDASGVEVAGLRDGSLASSFDAKGGQVLLVDLGQATATTALVVEAEAAPIGAKADSIGILVQKPAKGGEWTTIATIYPRRFADRTAVGAEGSSTLRLVSLRSYGIRSVSRMDVSAVAIPQEFVLASAEHSRLGSAVDAVRLSGGTSTKLEPGDTLELAYTATPVPPGMVRDVFLIAKGQYEAAAATTQLAQSGDLEQALQAQPVFEFALGQARPNPSRGSVSISYSLAQESPVSIRVYDVAGRLVRTLVNEAGAPGPHDVVWDATNDDGRRVAAGVYFYRMNAGAWQSQRKVVFLER